MNIFISGISGTGMGPLALFAHDAGHQVFGSDLHEGPITKELKAKNLTFAIGPQTGDYLEEIHQKHPIDWYVHTSAITESHPEYQRAKSLGLKISKRDELIETLVEKHHLKMVAVAGTHGKTTTTSMLIWLSQKLGLKASYMVGSTLNFAPSAKYDSGDQFLLYEADEYDRNFLAFHPWLSLITFVSYDHSDIFATEAEYQDAFLKFESQSEHLIFGPHANLHHAELLADKHPDVVLMSAKELMLPGEARRLDATLAIKAVQRILESLGREVNHAEIIEAINQFPGVGRRFERLADGLYSDYAHHPEEIRATINVALEEAKRTQKKGVVILYQPHQNIRQHEFFDEYRDIFHGIKRLYWLPTYLSREDPKLKILNPSDFLSSLDNPEIGTAAELDDTLFAKLRQDLTDNYLVILMSAGDADPWLRQKFL